MRFLKNMMIRRLTLFLFISLLIGCSNKSQPNISAEKKRELANVLYNQQLYAQAADEFRDYLSEYPLDAKEQANISYMVANIYFEKLRDYENALAFYLRLKYLYPESNLQFDVNKKVVACLERLKRSTDARQVIEQHSALSDAQKPKSLPGEIIARIGLREITSGDLEHEIRKLPPYMNDQVKTPEQKIEFLKNYIVQELLYDSAKRKGLDADGEVREGVVQAEKSLMTQKLLQQELDKESNIDKYTNADVELYYKANLTEYVEKDEKGKIRRQLSFAEAKEKVARDFIQSKKQEAYQRLIDRLMKAEQVQIYETKFK